MAIRKNITSATTTTLIKKGSSDTGNLSKILITNHDDSDNCVVKLQLNDGAGSPTKFIINETDIPARASLLLEDGITFQSSLFRLEVITSTDAEITIIIE